MTSFSRSLPSQGQCFLLSSPFSDEEQYMMQHKTQQQWTEKMKIISQLMGVHFLTWNHKRGVFWYSRCFMARGKRGKKGVKVESAVCYHIFQTIM